MREELSTYPAVLEVIQTYIDGCAGPDDNKIRSVFHPNAQLFGVFSGKTVVFPIEAWIDRVMGDPKPADDARITPAPTKGPAWWVDSVDVTENMARVVVISRFLDVWYTDLMTLLQTEDGWKIVNKTFTYEKK
ncbi:MAG: hypothetical protein HKP27_15545 [Myxococcales bacterium]|nr:hypothetical protein [Myxococcales bacterium]